MAEVQSSTSGASMLRAEVNKKALGRANLPGRPGGNQLITFNPLLPSSAFEANAETVLADFAMTNASLVSLKLQLPDADGGSTLEMQLALAGDLAADLFSSPTTIGQTGGHSDDDSFIAGLLGTNLLGSRFVLKTTTAATTPQSGLVRLDLVVAFDALMLK